MGYYAKEPFQSGVHIKASEIIKTSPENTFFYEVPELIDPNTGKSRPWEPEECETSDTLAAFIGIRKGIENEIENYTPLPQQTAKFRSAFTYVTMAYAGLENHIGRLKAEFDLKRVGLPRELHSIRGGIKTLGMTRDRAEFDVKIDRIDDGMFKKLAQEFGDQLPDEALALTNQKPPLWGAMCVSRHGFDGIFKINDGLTKYAVHISSSLDSGSIVAADLKNHTGQKTPELKRIYGFETEVVSVRSNKGNIPSEDIKRVIETTLDNIWPQMQNMMIEEALTNDRTNKTEKIINAVSKHLSLNDIRQMNIQPQDMFNPENTTILSKIFSSTKGITTPKQLRNMATADPIQRNNINFSQRNAA